MDWWVAEGLDAPPKTATVGDDDDDSVSRVLADRTLLRCGLVSLCLSVLVPVCLPACLPMPLSSLGG